MLTLRFTYSVIGGLDWSGLGNAYRSGPHGLACSKNLCRGCRPSSSPFSFPFLINIKLKDPRIHSDFWPVFSVAAGGETGGQNNNRLLTFWPVISSGLSWVPDKLYQRDNPSRFDHCCGAAALCLAALVHRHVSSIYLDDSETPFCVAST